MDYKELKSANFKSLSLVIALITFGWPQTIKAQYNLQLDSVITEVISGQATVTQSFYFVVPEGKIWKVQSAYFSGPDWGPQGVINLRVRDSNNHQFAVTKNGSSTFKNANIFTNHYLTSTGIDNSTGNLWLNSGSQVIFSITAASDPTTPGTYKGLISALQFSIE